MTIDLSKEDIEQIEKDGYLSVCIEDNGFCAVSVSAEYIKIVASMRGARMEGERVSCNTCIYNGDCERQRRFKERADVYCVHWDKR